MSFPPSFFEHLQDRLELAVYDTKQELHMALKLQGIVAKVAKLQHDAEFEAEKLDTKVEGVAARLPGAFSGAHGTVDGLAKIVGDVAGLATGLEVLGNGGPPLDPLAAPIAMDPPLETTTGSAPITPTSSPADSPDVVHDDTGAVVRPVLST